MHSTPASVARYDAAGRADQRPSAPSRGKPSKMPTIRDSLSRDFRMRFLPRPKPIMKNACKHRRLNVAPAGFDPATSVTRAYAVLGNPLILQDFSLSPFRPAPPFHGSLVEL